MMSEPKVFLNLIPTNDSYVLHQGTWVQESSRAMWKFPELGLSSPGSGVGSIRARFQLKDGPGYQVEILSTRYVLKNTSCQGTIAAQFNCEGTTLSGVEFELSGSGYRVSLVKRRFVSGDHRTHHLQHFITSPSTLLLTSLSASIILPSNTTAMAHLGHLFIHHLVYHYLN